MSGRDWIRRFQVNGANACSCERGCSRLATQQKCKVQGWESVAYVTSGFYSLFFYVLWRLIVRLFACVHSWKPLMEI